MSYRSRQRDMDRDEETKKGALPGAVRWRACEEEGGSLVSWGPGEEVDGVPRLVSYSGFDSSMDMDCWIPG